MLLNIHYKYIMKMESNNELIETDIKNCTCYYFNDRIEIEDFDFDYILINERSYENFLVYSSHAKLWLVLNLCLLGLIK